MCKLSYVDLFCGAGGFSLGLDKRGFKNIFSVDINPSFAKLIDLILIIIN